MCLWMLYVLFFVFSVSLCFPLRYLCRRSCGEAGPHEIQKNTFLFARCKHEREIYRQRERQITSGRIGLLKLAQHLQDECGPFLGEADLVHRPPDASIVATSPLVSQQPKPNKRLQS